MLEQLRKDQRHSKLDFLSRVNDFHCAARPIYGQEILDFLTFLPGTRPSQPARSYFLAQANHKADHWLQSQALKDAIHNTEERLDLLTHMIDRYGFC